VGRRVGWRSLRRWRRGLDHRRPDPYGSLSSRGSLWKRLPSPNRVVPRKRDGPVAADHSSRRATAIRWRAARVAGGMPPTSPISSANTSLAASKRGVTRNAKARWEKVYQLLVPVVRPFRGSTAAQPRTSPTPAMHSAPGDPRDQGPVAASLSLLPTSAVPSIGFRVAPCDQLSRRAELRRAISSVVRGLPMARPALAARYAEGAARHQVALVCFRGNDVDSLAVMRMHRKRKTKTGWQTCRNSHPITAAWRSPHN
jgi:hypothetical protein